MLMWPTRQFLNHRGRTFDDLSGSDFVGDGFGEDVNFSHANVSGFEFLVGILQGGRRLVGFRQDRVSQLSQFSKGWLDFKLEFRAPY